MWVKNQGSWQIGPHTFYKNRALCKLNWAPHFLWIKKQGSRQTKLGPTLFTCGLKRESEIFPVLEDIYFAIADAYFSKGNFSTEGE